MRVSDIKQSLWYLVVGLVACSVVVVVWITWIKPPVSNAAGFDRWAKAEMVAALRVDADSEGGATAAFDKAFPATFGLKINGIEPPKPAPVRRPDTGKPPPPPPDRPLSDFIVLSAVFGKGVQYRLRQGDTGIFEVGLGDVIPEKHATISPEAKLIAIKVEEFPIQVVFKVRDDEEVLLVPRDDLRLQRPDDGNIVASEPYQGPKGTVTPMRRTVEPGVTRAKDGKGYVIGQSVQDVFRNRADQLLKGIAWDQTDKGIRITKIRKGSLADQMLGQVKAIGGSLLRERDIVMSVNGVKVQSKAQILSHFRSNPVPAGGTVTVQIWRNGAVKTEVVRVPRR